MALKPEQQRVFDEILQRGIDDADKEMMRLALERGSTPNLLITGLAHRGNLANADEALLTLALKQGADANLLLVSGIRARSLAVVKTAVEKGQADVNGSYAMPGERQKSPMSDRAYTEFNTSVSEYLIGKGMDINKQNADGETPLLRAVCDQNFPVAEHYLSHGADPLIADNDGKFPLDVVQHASYSYASGLDDKRPGIIKAMLKNIPAEDAKPAAPAPAPAFNQVATDAPIEVSHPLELKKKAESSGDRPAKGFSL